MNTILITGAGSGIGAAVARRLSRREGIRLMLWGRRLSPLEEVRESLDRNEDHVIASMDIADADAMETWLAGEEADLDTYPLVGVFANAGVGGPNAFGPGDRWEQIIRINLTGTYNTLMTCRPYMAASSGVAHALVTSSVLARFGVPGQSAYVTSKTGLLGLVRSLAVEWSSQGILVNAICPGWVDTEMAKESIQAMADAEGISYEESLAQQERILPAGRISKPEEMAEWINFMFAGLGEGEKEARVETFTGQALDVNSGSWMG